MKFEIRGSLPTMNEIIDASKQHWSDYHQMKSFYTQRVKDYIRDRTPMNRVSVHIIWFCPNKRIDPDNISAGIKFILDGLVEAGVLKNDGWKEIARIKHDFRIDRDNPRIEVILTEVG